MVSRSNAYLFLSHFLSEEILFEFEKISLSSKNLGDAWLLLQMEEFPQRSDIKETRIHLSTQRDIESLNYRPRKVPIIPGNVHFPLLHFFLSNPNYERYWLIEYDVRYTGTWRHLFSAFKADKSDLITSHLRTYDQEPDWPHWELTHPTLSVPLDKRIRGFNPIFRISGPALRHIHISHKDGWQGHNEVLLPTLLHQSKFSLSDFGGEGSFVPPKRKNHFYISNLTQRYRPVHENTAFYWKKIYHPVKASHRSAWRCTPKDQIARWITRLQYALLKIINLRR